MDKLDSVFGQLFAQSDNTMRFFCPGRINLIGEHIDYLGGLVMPAAISLGITAICRPNSSNVLRIHSTDFNETIAFDLRSLPLSKQGSWSDFVLGVVLNLIEQRIEPTGCDILIDSDLPKGTGLSSSAAIEVICYFMFYSVFAEKKPNRTQMALDCQKIENEFIGLNCGIMDQFAVANGKAGHAMVLDCNTLEHELVTLNLADYSLVIINTNKPRTLAESAYNQRRSECDEALKIISTSREIENLTEATIAELELIQDPILKKRARHAVTEQLRVTNSVRALGSGDLVAFGKLLTESHTSLRDDYEVSCAELDFVVNQLVANPSCVGARMTGAGFGGCCIALINSKDILELTAELNETYRVRFEFSPFFYDCKTSDGVHRIT